MVFFEQRALIVYAKLREPAPRALAVVAVAPRTKVRAVPKLPATGRPRFIGVARDRALVLLGAALSGERRVPVAVLNGEPTPSLRQKVTPVNEPVRVVDADGRLVSAHTLFVDLVGLSLRPNYFVPQPYTVWDFRPTDSAASSASSGSAGPAGSATPGSAAVRPRESSSGSRSVLTYDRTLHEHLTSLAGFDTVA